MRLTFWLVLAVAVPLVNCGPGGVSTDRGTGTSNAAQKSVTVATSDSAWPAARGYSQMVYDPIHEDVILLPGQSNTFTVAGGLGFQH